MRVPSTTKQWEQAGGETTDEQEEQRPHQELHDLQCACPLLALCGSPRANHALRTVPPSGVARYAAVHDAARLLSCIGEGPEPKARVAWPILGVPAILGGLGFGPRRAPALASHARPPLRSRMRRRPTFREPEGASIPSLLKAHAAAPFRRHPPKDGYRTACPTAGVLGPRGALGTGGRTGVPRSWGHRSKQRHAAAYEHRFPAGGRSPH